jgi:hypothetical protein
MPKNIFLKAIVLCIFLAVLLVALNFLLLAKVKIDKSSGNPFRPNNKIETFQSNHIGEKIIYDVKLGKLYLGEARFANIANAQVNSKVLNVMVLETKLAQFTDTEKIYSDPQTLLPVRVEWDILNWFVQEIITEEYDQDNFTVTIIKDKGSSQEKTVIKKNSHIHNAILLPYHVRYIPKMDVGRIIIANLPTRRLEIKLTSIEEIKVPAGTFQAYHFTSTPKQIDIWISADERRLPIKIQGSGIFGYTLAMKEHSF